MVPAIIQLHAVVKVVILYIYSAKIIIFFQILCILYYFLVICRNFIRILLSITLWSKTNYATEQWTQNNLTPPNRLAAMDYKLTIRGQQHVISRPEVMGILNCTPDSFYAGSRKQTEEEIALRANEIIAQGATMIDVGGMSTRPGSGNVTPEEEMRRLRLALPIVKREQPDAIISVDTFRPEVARMAVEEFGVDIINDVGEAEEFLTADLGWMKDIPYILMSVQPTLESTLSAFRSKTALLQEKGIGDIILDPGYGFARMCRTITVCSQDRMNCLTLACHCLWECHGSE